MTIESSLPVSGTETLNTLDATGRVLAGDLLSQLDVPTMDNTQMDGYAVRAADVATASESHPAALRVVMDIPAGTEILSFRDAWVGTRPLKFVGTFSANTPFAQIDMVAGKKAPLNDPVEVFIRLPGHPKRLRAGFKGDRKRRKR